MILDHDAGPLPRRATATGELGHRVHVQPRPASATPRTTTTPRTGSPIPWTSAPTAARPTPGPARSVRGTTRTWSPATTTTTPAAWTGRPTRAASSHRTSYDLLGRTTQTIAAYVDGTPSAADDQTTQYTYDGDGHTADADRGHAGRHATRPRSTSTA